jgi:hypothetical protein
MGYEVKLERFEGPLDLLLVQSRRQIHPGYFNFIFSIIQ